jgi:branched-chain amino acid transport system permease protein
MIGSFVSVSLFATLGLTSATGVGGLILGLLATLIVAMVACGTLNVLLEKVGYRPLRAAPKLAPLITAVGFSFILQNVGLLWRGGSPQSIDDLIDSQHVLVDIFGVPITNGDVLAVGVTFPLVFLMTTFIARSRLGKAMRATAQNPTAARLMGIDVDRVIGATFMMGGALAGFAAVIYGLYINTIHFQMGYQNGLYAFTAAVLGGIGNIPGAVLGGLVIGLLRALSDQYVGAQWQQAMLFGVLIAILVFRPQGLFGSTAHEKV